MSSPKDMVVFWCSVLTASGLFKFLESYYDRLSYFVAIVALHYESIVSFSFDGALSPKSRPTFNDRKAGTWSSSILCENSVHKQRRLYLQRHLDAELRLLETTVGIGLKLIYFLVVVLGGP